MKVDNINRANNNLHGRTQINFKGMTYNPEGIKSTINPARVYINKFIGRTLATSKKSIRLPEPDIAPITHVVRLRDDKGNGTYAWDINDGSRKKYVMIMHGLSQNITTIQHLYQQIIEKTDYAILAPEYRGFGENPTEKIKPSTFLEDNTRALEYLKQDKNISPKNIRIVGYSFGGSPATQLAMKNPDLEGLILVSAADSMNNGSINIDSSFQKKLPKFIKMLYNRLSFLKKPFDSFLGTEKYLKRSKLPVDLIHSENDKTVSVSASLNLAVIAGTHTNSRIILPTGGHALDSTKVNAIVNLLSSPAKTTY